MVKEFNKNKDWALIIGGSSGLGLASAKKLALHGMNICIVHRDRKSVLKVFEEEIAAIKTAGVEVLNFNIDATNTEKMAEVIAHLASEKISIKCLLHSISKGNLKEIASGQERSLKNDDFQISIHAMGISLYNWAKEIFDKKLYADKAVILAFTSEGGRKAWKHYAAVSAAKASLEAISRSLALEFAPFGIRSNCIQAGVTDTPSLRMIPGSEQLIRYTQKRNPYKRLTNPEDVANVVYLLCKDEATWINGAIIPVDGGEQIC